MKKNIKPRVSPIKKRNFTNIAETVEKANKRVRETLKNTSNNQKNKYYAIQFIARIKK